MTREQAIRAQKWTPNPNPNFTTQPTNGKFSSIAQYETGKQQCVELQYHIRDKDKSPLLRQATLIICTIYATVAIFCLVCALVVGIMQL